MTPAELEQYAKDNNSTIERYYRNGQEFIFIQLPDDWTAVFMKENCDTYTPMIQAANRQHARTYCSMLEPVSIPFSVIE